MSILKVLTVEVFSKASSAVSSALAGVNGCQTKAKAKAAVSGLFFVSPFVCENKAKGGLAHPL